MDSNAWSWLDGEMSFIPTNERIFLPCSCCGKSMVKGTQCIACNKVAKHNTTMFFVSMVTAAVLTIVLL